MAERRMFAKTIIDSDAFLDMPLSTQALYFHLSMRADDEGFINSPKKIQRMIGCSDDDLKLLIAKRFIIPFDSGVVVIKHWRIHNYIQSDRRKPTVYTEERALLTTKKNGVYTLVGDDESTVCIQDGYKVDTTCIQDASKADTQVRLGKDSIGKVSLGKDSLGEDKKERKPAARTGYDLIIDEATENDELKDAIHEFIKMRKLIRKPMTDQALKLMLGKLTALAGDDDKKKIAILNQSIANCWQGVFELKEDGGSRSFSEAKKNPALDYDQRTYSDDEFKGTDMSEWMEQNSEWIKEATV